MTTDKRDVSIYSFCHDGRRRPRSPETKAKISAALTGRSLPESQRINIRNSQNRADVIAKKSSALKGRTLSPENRKKISVGQMGRVHSPETRAKMSAAAKGKPSHNKGIPMSEEQKSKISAAKLGKPFSCEHRKMFLGENNPNWNGGSSFKPYCPKWTDDLRERIRAFFEYQCVACGKSTEENKRALSCHHVSYDKMVCCNGNPARFAALCHRHHNLTNSDRDRWEAMLNRIIDEIYGGKSYFTSEEYDAIK